MSNLIDQINEYMQAGTSAIKLLREAASLLPKGEKKTKAEADIEKATESLTASKAALAQSLGYTLCRCTFPPQIMLWEQSRKSEVCPRCRHRKGDDLPSVVRQNPDGGGWSRR